MEDINTKMWAIWPTLIGIGVLTVLFIGAVLAGYFRVHIENMKTRKVWILNADSENAVTLQPGDIICLREKKCELLEDGTIKLRG